MPLIDSEGTHWGKCVGTDGSIVDRTWRNLESGLIPIEELDDEELSKGKMRDSSGGWRAMPTAISRKTKTAVVRQLFARYEEKMRLALLNAQTAYVDIAMSDETGPADRLRALQYIQERVVGKIPDKVEISAEIKPWEGLVEGILHDITDEDDETKKEADNDTEKGGE